MTKQTDPLNHSSTYVYDAADRQTSSTDRDGRVINFASIYGQICTTGTLAYNITKEAVRGLTRTAAREWARHGITARAFPCLPVTWA